jgi:glycosyltransferase involved in cell wall biosynthesis
VTATRTETQGLAVLEAMSLGLPVVAPAVGGLVELIPKPALGCLVASEPRATLHQRIAQSIATLAAEPERAATIGRDAANWARQRFAPRPLAARLAEAYQALDDAPSDGPLTSPRD